jgi:hypothetical protein
MNKLQNIVDNTLHSQAHWKVNKAMARFLESNDSGIILSELIFLKRQHPKVDMPFLQQDKLADRCNVSIHKLRTCLDNLKKHKLITTEKKGMPAKNHFKINYDQIITLMSNTIVDHQSSEIPTTSAQVTTQVIEKVDNKSSKKSTTSGTKSKPHIKELSNKELPIKEVLPKKEIKYNHSTNKPIDKDIVIDKVSLDIEYINSVPENMLTREQLAIKSDYFFS